MDQTEEMRNRIVEANFKWRQAQMMVDYAHKQLEYAVQKWKDIEEINQRYIQSLVSRKSISKHQNEKKHDYFSLSYPFFLSELEERYAVAAETRNNLVAASQNIQGAQRYLSNIQFPYCAPPEVDTLNKVRSIKPIITPNAHFMNM